MKPSAVEFLTNRSQFFAEITTGIGTNVLQIMNLSCKVSILHENLWTFPTLCERDTINV